MRVSFSVLIFFALIFQSCDTGLQPAPPPPPFGTVLGTVEYQGSWPPADSVRDLRFVAMRTVPQTVSDFLNLSEIVFTPFGLKKFVTRDTFIISNVTNDVYVYSGVAQLYGPNPFADWRPIGLYSANDGVFEVLGDTTRIHVIVDFNNIPQFPPQ